MDRTIAIGTNVYTQDGAKVGDVSDVGDGYLFVQKGWLFVTDRYVPLSAVDHVADDGVYLNVAHDHLERQDWSAPPSAERVPSDATVGTTSMRATDADETIYAHPRTTPSSATAATTTRQDTASLDQTGEVKIPVVEEELQVGTREVERGGVRVNTRVEEVPVNEQVTLHEETVEVHRTPVDRPVADADRATFQEGTFEVRERDEEAIVQKQARVVEEVHIKKAVEERTETVQDTVRRTDVDVEDLAGTSRTTETETVGRIGTQGVTGRDTDEGAIERGASTLENAAERATGADLNRDGDVGQRDPRNNY